MVDNKSYWEERMEIAFKLSEKQVGKPLKKLYRKAFHNIQTELLNTWLDMGKDGDVSQAALYQKNRMANLQALRSKELRRLGETSLQYLQISLSEAVEQGSKDMDAFLGVAGKVSFLDETVAKEIVNQNYKGASFSERIWDDMDKLKTQIESSITKSALQGKDVRDVAKELQERMNVSYSSSKRITITETGRVFNEGCRQKAMERGYLSYRVLLEPDACEDCVNAFRGKHFNIKESVLPGHPHCKCTMLIDV